MAEIDSQDRIFLTALEEFMKTKDETLLKENLLRTRYDTPLGSTVPQTLEILVTHFLCLQPDENSPIAALVENKKGRWRVKELPTKKDLKQGKLQLKGTSIRVSLKSILSIAKEKGFKFSFQVDGFKLVSPEYLGKGMQTGGAYIPLKITDSFDA